MATVGGTKPHTRYPIRASLLAGSIQPLYMWTAQSEGL